MTVNIHIPGSAPERNETVAGVLKTGPFADALRVAIRDRGLSLDRLQQRLASRGARVGTATLSCWQKGTRHPERPASLRAVSVLEEVLDLPTGSLLVLLGPPKPRGPHAGLPQGTRTYSQVMVRPASVLALLAELGTTADGKLHFAAQHESIYIGADRSCRRREMFQVLRAHQDGVDRYIAFVTPDPGADLDRLEVRAMENCRVGRVRRDREGGVLAAELLFDLALRSGETHLIHYEVVDHSWVDSREYERGFRFPAGQYAVQVLFSPEALPVACWSYRRKDVSRPEQETAELTLTGHHGVHLNVDPVPPGVVGIRWEWA